MDEPNFSFPPTGRLFAVGCPCLKFDWNECNISMCRIAPKTDGTIILKTDKSVMKQWLIGFLLLKIAVKLI
jgi:hypothetical protein